MRCASMRPSTSVGPPAANGTTRVMGRAGQSCADAAGIAPASAQAISSAFAEVIFLSLPFSPPREGQAYSIRGRPTRLDRRRPLPELAGDELRQDRKSTRLNSSHLGISYAVFCLKKK